MSNELPGQLPLFTLEGCDEAVQSEFADEICRDPGCWCASVPLRQGDDDPA